MPYLNIPLGRTKTARRSRRAVWLWSGCLMGWILLAWAGGALWQTRDSLSRFAPKSTAVVVHLTPTKTEWHSLLENFSNTTLVSGQFLTLRELASLSPKEFTVFIDASGDRSLAVRASLDAETQYRLEAYGIFIQKLGSQRYLLSGKPLPFSTERKTVFEPHSILPFVFGTIRFIEDKRSVFSSPLVRSRRGYSFSLPKVEVSPLPTDRLPENTVAAMVIPSLSENLLDKVSEQLETTLRPINTGLISNILASVNSGDSLIAYSMVGSAEYDFLLRLAKKIDKTELLKTVASFKNPLKRNFTLPDGSQATELYIDENAVALEEVSLAGMDVGRVQTSDGEFFATEDENWLYLATNEVMLSDWLIKTGNAKTALICGNQPFAFVRVGDVLELMSHERTRVVSPLGVMWGEFQEISLSSGFFSTKFEICR